MNACALETGKVSQRLVRYLPQTRDLLLIQNPSAEWTEATVHEWLAQDHDANCHSRESNPDLSSESPTLYRELISENLCHEPAVSQSNKTNQYRTCTAPL